MKVVILAGGFGTRISEYSETVPKPMISIGGKPILWHIMQRYAHFGHKDFYLALGYKAEIVKDYFLNYRGLNADFTVDLGTGDIKSHQVDAIDWTVTLIQTGITTMTGGRLKRLKEFIGNETFLLTYGDGLSSVNIDELIAFHRSQGKMITVTAVRPTARFGELELNGFKVNSFREKPQLNEGWINGGYFVIEPEFLNLIEGDQTLLEREPLEKVSSSGELVAYCHNGFWQCMDTKRDRELLEAMWERYERPWLSV